MILAKLPSHNRNSLLHQITNTLYNQPPPQSQTKNRNINTCISTSYIFIFNFHFSITLWNAEKDMNHTSSWKIKACLPPNLLHILLKHSFPKHTCRNHCPCFKNRVHVKGWFFFFYKKICNEFHIQHVQCKWNLRF